MRHGTLTLLAAGLALTLAVPAVAAGWGPEQGGPFRMAQSDDQDGARAPGGMMGMFHGMMGRGDQARDGERGPESHFLRMCETADARHAAMLAYAEVRLKLTDVQKPAWTKFTEAAKAAHANMTKLCELKDKPAPATLPERLARAEQVTQARLAHLQALRPALETLYKELTPEQQKTADSLPFAGHGHGHHGHHHPM